VTDRNPRKHTQWTGRALPRIALPLLLLGTTSIAMGCFRQAGAPSAPPVRLDLKDNTQLLQVTSDAQLGGEDPSLSMPEVNDGKASMPDRQPVQMLPLGDLRQRVTTTTSDEASQPVATAPVTRWVKNNEATRLWSSARPDTAAFTDLPSGSYLRVEGSVESGRLPVYYVGDGLYRRPGNAWIDSSVVETVDAPAPGQVQAVDADASQPLPVWLQAHRATTLWSGPDDKAVALTDLPQWTFLRVSGVGRDARVLVNYAGDYATRQAGIGWVELSAVGPAGDPGRWVTNHLATALWSGVDDKAMRFTDLAQWTKLRIVDGAVVHSDRMQIEFFGDGRSRQPGVAWIDRAAIGPITPPVPLPAAQQQTQTVSASRRVESYAFSSGDDFINTVGEAARRSMRSTGVPASVTVAQAILESDWGRSRLTRQGNNLFGIKALNAPGPAGVVTLSTWEHLNGSDVVVQAPFRAYHNLEESVTDHGLFFVRNKRYSGAMSVASDARAFARGIQDAGYATDPSYASKLVRLMDRYDLYRFDS
jgi:hypothetical protein